MRAVGRPRKRESPRTRGGPEPGGAGRDQIGRRMWRRFATYGAVGWLLEVVMTGAHSVLRRRDVRAVAQTYLWRHPSYGIGGILLARISRPRRRRRRSARSLACLPALHARQYRSP